MSLMSTSKIFTAEHEEVLTELINMGFGSAISPIAELIGRFIRISVPEIQQLDLESVSARLQDFITPEQRIHAIGQTFYSQFTGEALLLLNASPTVLNELLQVDPDDEFEQKDALLEIGNILISACVGQVVDLIQIKTQFSPPNIILFNQEISDLNLRTSKGSSILLIKTSFGLETLDFDGFLLLMVKEDVLKILAEKIDEMLDEL